MRIRLTLGMVHKACTDVGMNASGLDAAWLFSFVQLQQVCRACTVGIEATDLGPNLGRS